MTSAGLETVLRWHLLDMSLLRQLDQVRGNILFGTTPQPWG
jgi:hypothetical protein